MMPSVQNSKVTVPVNGTISTSATSSSRIDRLGFDYAAIDVIMPVATATNSSATFGTMKLTESDTTTFATTAVATGGTDFTIPVQNDTSNPAVMRFLVDCKARKRYLFVNLQAAASHSTVTVRAELVRAEQAPITDANRGTGITTWIG